MPPTTSYSFGDIVLVPFPFTDQSRTKRRPAVVVSSRAYHLNRPDLIIMAVTSQVRPAGAIGDVNVKVQINLVRRKSGVIPRPRHSRGIQGNTL